MTYPSPSDYQDALQFPEDVFADPLLAAGTPVPGPLGLPRLLTGAFAAVFPVDTAEGRKAIRCFLSDAPERRRRAEALAAHLRERPLEAFVPFAYQERGLRIGRQVLPIVVMDWVEGEGLGRYVARHHAEPATLAALAEAWTRLVDELAQARVAHGDLQPGNVLVQAHDGEPRLVLVDYDAAVVPALVGRPVPEAGHRHFQHPERGDAPADLSLDRFAALVVLTALEALQEAPALWARYDTGENLLFTAEDFFAPERSPLFAELQALPRVRPLAAALAAACYLPPDRTPTLGEARRGAVPAVRARTRRSGPREPVRRAGFARWAAPVLAAALALALLASLVQPAAGAAALAGAAVALAAWGA
ncbi:MAG: lipopolysaccharide kinase InaA family protein, partial [Rubricoccaceae bacterium]